MASLNECSFIGNLGRDPESRFLTSGDQVTNFSIACNETWKDKDGEKKERVEWVRVVAFGKLAEIIGKYLTSGSQVFIRGRMQTRKYEKDGQDHYSTEIVADKMVMLGGKRNEDNAGERHTREENESDNRTAKASKTKDTAEGFDDEIPF